MMKMKTALGWFGASKSLFAMVFLSAMLGLSGCDKDGPAEQAGEKVDQAAEKAGEKMEEAKESLSE
jgi:hyperosmotically inducible protein